MAKYKVIALNATGLNGKVHYAKEVLTEDQLGGKKRAESLAKQGFVEVVESEVAKKAQKKQDNTKK